eukprot:scaffold8574_cov286-Pinguiococcus_pyrenoidosus.AAC.1
MPHSYGYRARTRDMFSRDFRTKGHLNATTYLTVYKRGDFVDIKCNPMIHKGRLRAALDSRGRVQLQWMSRRGALEGQRRDGNPEREPRGVVGRAY